MENVAGTIKEELKGEKGTTLKRNCMEFFKIFYWWIIFMFQIFLPDIKKHGLLPGFFYQE